MIDKRTQNPADLVSYYVTLIVDERHKLQEALAAIAEYSEQLRKVASETERKLLTKE